MKIFVNAVIIMLSMLFCTSAIAADTFKDESAMKKFGDSFMEKIGSGEMNAAFKVLRPYVEMNDIDFDSAVNESTQQRLKFAMQYGAPKGYKFIRQRTVSDILYNLQYVEIAEKQAIVWSFYFLKVDGIWRLDDFDWNDRLSTVFGNN